MFKVTVDDDNKEDGEDMMGDITTDDSIPLQQEDNISEEFHSGMIVLRQKRGIANESNNTKGIGDAQKSRRAKSKKKVSFKADEHLVRVVEISPRPESPIYEELEPCDPQKLLLEQLEIQKDAFQGDFGYHRLRKNNDVVARITGISGLGLNSGFSAKSNDRIRSSNGTVYRPATSKERSDTARLSQISAIARRSKSATVNKTPAPKGILSNTNMSGDPFNEQRAQRHNSKVDSKTKSGVYAEKHLMSSSFMDSTLRSKSNINLNTKGLNKGLNLKINGESMSSGNRVHSSPYRQSSASVGRPLGCVRMESGSNGLLVSGSQVDPDQSRDRRALSAQPATRKLFAWQVTSSTVRGTNPDISAPFISQLWNSLPKSKIDTVHGSTCS